MIDIVEIKSKIKDGDLTVCIYNGNIILKDNRSGEAVKIGDSPEVHNCEYKPTEKQWKRIKRFASKDGSAKPSDVFVVELMLCDDKIDSANEKFDPECFPELAEMFIGIRGYFGRKNAVHNTNSVIFDAETVIKNGVRKIRAWAFVYKSPRTEEVLRELSDGKKIKASIGLSIKTRTCSICGRPYGYLGCDHIKGELYANDKRCYVILSDPDMAYEFSAILSEDYD